MPSSHSVLIHPFVRMLRKLRPRSVLDVGVGFGKFGFLTREYLDVMAAAEDTDKYQRERWGTRVDGVEVHEQYITDVHRLIYDTIHIGDIVELLPTLERYDLIWMADVIEHFEKERGLALLQGLIDKASLMVGVSTPYGGSEQEEMFDNPHERHLSAWTEADFARWPEGGLYRLNKRMLLFLYSKDPERHPPRGIGKLSLEVYRPKNIFSHWRKK